MTNVSAVTKHFPSAEEGFTTTLSSTVSAGATTVGLNSLSGYTTGEVATFVVAPTVSSEKQVFTGLVDTAGLQLTNVVWTTGTNQTHAAGTTVVDYVTATHMSQVSKGILEEHNQDGSHGAITATSVASTGAVSGTTGTFTSDITEKGATLATMRDELGYDYVASGGIWSGDSYGSTRNASMTALVCYINGQRGTISAVTARSFTASKDTYIDVLNSSGTFSLVYTEVTNNAASPALAANSLRLGIVVTGASNIAAATSINQGNWDAPLPVVSGEYLTGLDSVGNPIYNTSPEEISYVRTGTSSPAPTVEADVAGATSTLILTKRSKLNFDLFSHFQLNSGATRTAFWKLYINGVALTQLYSQDNPGATETHWDSASVAYKTLDAGTHTIKCRAVATTGGTVAMSGGFRLRVR